MSTATTTATLPHGDNAKIKTKQPQVTHVADPDAKRFYEKRNQSTRNLMEGDLIYHDERLVMVKNIGRNGQITLDDGHTFDGKPSGEPWDEWKTRITFWRPRQGF